MREWASEIVALTGRGVPLDQVLNAREREGWLLCSLLPFPGGARWDPFTALVWYREAPAVTVDADGVKHCTRCGGALPPAQERDCVECHLRRRCEELRAERDEALVRHSLRTQERGRLAGQVEHLEREIEKLRTHLKWHGCCCLDYGMTLEEMTGG